MNSIFIRKFFISIFLFSFLAIESNLLCETDCEDSLECFAQITIEKESHEHECETNLCEANHRSLHQFVTDSQNSKKKTKEKKTPNFLKSVSLNFAKILYEKFNFLNLKNVAKLLTNKIPLFTLFSSYLN